MGNYRYILKPSIPTIKEEKAFEEVIEKTCKFCLDNKIDEVICCIDFNNGSGISLTAGAETAITASMTANSATGVSSSLVSRTTIMYLANARDLFKAAGLGFSISLVFGQMSQNNNDGENCPFTDKWIERVCSVYSDLASFHPDVLWIDEDFRMFDEHKQSFWFFCDEFLRKFSGIIGEDVSKDDLVRAITSPGEAHPWREVWIRMCGRILADACKKIANAVFTVDADITMGIMGSNIYAHAMEGRNWEDIFNELSGKKNAICSLGFEDRNDNLPKDITFGQDNARATAAFVLENTICYSRIDSDGYSTFSKSVKFSRLQLGMAAIEGCNNSVINLFGAIGSKAYGEDELCKMLSIDKPYFEGLSNIDGKLLGEQGVYIPVVKDAPSKYIVPVSGLENGIEDIQNKGNLWSNVIQRFGIPTIFKADEANVAAFMGQSVRGMAHDEIMKILSTGALLDAVAAESLIDMGYGEYLGVTPVKKISTDDMAIGAEEADFYVRDNIKIDYMTILWLSENRIYDGIVTFTKFDLADGAKAITWIVNENRERIFPGMIYYENSLGGRVAVHSCVMWENTCSGQYNWGRAKAMTNAIKWLSNDRNFLCCPNNPDFFCLWRKYEGFDFVGFANMSYDDASEIILEIRNTDKAVIKDVLMCNTDGSWAAVEYDVAKDSSDIYEITIKKGLKFMDFGAVKIIKDQGKGV